MTSVSLAGRQSDVETNGRKKGKDSLKAIKSFLETYSAAKIVIIIETHCIENGRFVWKGESPTTYEACPLIEVSLVCILYELCADSINRSFGTASHPSSSHFYRMLPIHRITSTEASS